MCISGRTQANVMDQDTTQITATCADKQSKRIRSSICVTAVVAITRGIGAAVGGANKTMAKSNACVVCAQGDNAARCNYE